MFESLKERLLRRTYLTRIDVRESFIKENVSFMESLEQNQG